MAVKFSGTQPVYSTLRADTSVHLRGDLDNALIGAGWTHDTVLSSGYLYQLQSPQGLACKCRIQDTGATETTTLGTTEHYLEIQFQSDDTALQGVEHRLIYSSTNTSYAGGYQVIAGICQMFLSMPGITDEQMAGGHRANTVAGGIPAIPDDVSTPCQITGAPTITDNWWSCGIAKNGDPCARTSRYFRNNYSYCRNGILYTKDVVLTDDSDSYETMPLQFLPLTATQNIDYFPYIYPQVLKYNDSVPLVIDALMGFHWVIVGQVWDAFQMSAPTSIDDIVTSTETDEGNNSFTATWQAFNYHVPSDGKGGVGTWFATLYLLRSMPGEDLCNYAY